MQHHANFDSPDLIAGIDTHTDTHTLAILTAQGGTILTETFTADTGGYAALVTALETAGHIAVVGVEGTNSYGAGLSRALIAAGYTVKEVLRPARQVRRMNGKSDPIDAVEAARTVIAGCGVSDAKDSTTAAESLRFLLTARAQLVRTMTALSNSITSMLVTAPDTIRAKYRNTATQALIKRLAACRPDEQIDTPRTAALHAMRQLARARLDASSRADDLEEQMQDILDQNYPQILAIYGAGTITAAQLAVTAGGNPHRIRNEAAFATLCGAAPIPASSGRTNRHRLNRGGDRRGNNALHRIALIRMQHDKTTQDYVARKTSEGKGTKEILRCLKRAIAREAYRALTTEQSTTSVPDLKTLRESKKYTLSQAAEALHTWPARISDIEKKRRPLPELTANYKQWLQTA